MLYEVITVSERIEESGLSAPPGVAGLLLAGLLSDTLILNSPTIQLLLKELYTLDKSVITSYSIHYTKLYD